MKKLLNLLCIFSLQMLTGQVNLNSSLTACYPLNANANDAINSLTGTLSAVTPTVDRFNNPNSAYRFAGSTGSYIELPNNPLLKPDAVSFSAWVRFENMNAGQYVVFVSNTCGSFHEGYTVASYFTGGTYRFQAVKSFSTCSGMNQIGLTGNTVLNAFNWYHVGFYIGPDSMKLYVNGVLDGQLANPNPIVYDPNKKVFLGGSGQTFNLPLTGSIDNVRFYNRKLLGYEFNQLHLLDPACIAVPTGTAPVVSFSVSGVNLCAGNSISLTDLSSNSPTAWNWQIPGAIPPVSMIANPLITFPNPGNYIVSLVSSNTVGASNTATQTIVVLPNPTLTVLANSPSVCIGQNTNLFASGASTFTWSTFQQGPSINVAPIINTTFSVTGTDNNGCSNTGMVSVAVNPLPTVTAIASKSLICRGQNVTFTAGGASTYTWNSQQTSTTIVVSPFVNTSYYVTGTDLNSCKNTASVSVTVSECIGSNENVLQNGFSVFPNPGNGAYEIKFSESKTGELKLYNSLSQLLLQIQFENKEGMQLDLLDQPNGIYVLTLNIEGGISHFRIFKTD